ncbi:MAG: TetR/AcrR family transcriptional regulator [candidate division Zixibacteria bacterium]
MPKTVDREQKKDMILKAAMRLFARKGIAETKMEEVAKEAKIAKGTIYEYFKSREELLNLAFNYLLVLINKLVRQRMADAGSPAEKIKAGFLAYLDTAALGIEDYAQILPDLWAYGIRERVGETEIAFDLSWIYHQFREQYSEAFKAGITDGIFRDMDTDAAASSITAAGDGFYLQWMADRENFDLQKAADVFIENYISGIKR